MAVIIKKVFIIISFSAFFSFSSFSQNRNNIWMLGNAGCAGTSYQYSGINFNSGIADTFSLIRQIAMFITNTNICDTSGNLLFYTNGVKIGNANHDTLLNSTDYNPGYESTINCEQLATIQAVVVLPKPNSDSLYYILHESGEQFFAYGNNQISPVNLKYSVVDMSLDGGLGGITPSQKSIVITNDTMANGLIAACKHGNGRDWWIVAPRFWSNKYYKLLLSNDSIRNISSQNIGDSIIYDIGGQAVFSPNGNWYAIVDNVNNLNIYRFDRCTGLFFDSTYISVPNPTPSTFDNRTVGLSFSPSSRYLYVILYSHILQYDMQAANIASTQTYVAQWDTFYNPLQTNFFNAQLAPDNKIYIGTWAGSYNLHYIDQPDSNGLACNVIQNTFIISTNQVGNATVPTFPNYDLGRWVGSPCDTLTGIEETKSIIYPIRIFPNPANDFIYINYKIQANQTAQFILYNTMGEEISRNNLYGSFKSILVHTNKLTNGIYYYNIVLQNKIISGGKIAIIH